MGVGVIFGVDVPGGGLLPEEEGGVTLFEAGGLFDDVGALVLLANKK